MGGGDSDGTGSATVGTKAVEEGEAEVNVKSVCRRVVVACVWAGLG